MEAYIHWLQIIQRQEVEELPVKKHPPSTCRHWSHSALYTFELNSLDILPSAVSWTCRNQMCYAISPPVRASNTWVKHKDPHSHFPVRVIMFSAKKMSLRTSNGGPPTHGLLTAVCSTHADHLPSYRGRRPEYITPSRLLLTAGVRMRIAHESTRDAVMST